MIEDTADVVAVSTCTSITGSLIVTRASVLMSLELPMLAEVGGDLAVHDNGYLRTLMFPQLSTIGGAFTLSSNPMLSEASLPRLSRVSGGSLTVLVNPRLGRMSLPALTEVGGRIRFEQNTGLISISFMTLTTIGKASAEGGPWRNDDYLLIMNNQTLAMLAMPALRTVVGCGTMCGGGADIVVVRNSRLPNSEAEALVNQLVGFTGTIAIGQNL